MKNQKNARNYKLDGLVPRYRIDSNPIRATMTPDQRTYHYSNNTILENVLSMETDPENNGEGSRRRKQKMDEIDRYILEE